MSWLSHAVGKIPVVGHALNQVGAGIDKVNNTVGHAVGQVASNPWVDAGLAGVLGATGVGAPAAAAILAGTKGLGSVLKPGGNIGDALKGAATGAVTGYGGDKLGAGLASAFGSGDSILGGIQNVGGKLMSGGLGGLGDAAKGLGGAVLGGLTGSGGSGGGGFDLGQAGRLGLGAAQAANAANLQKQSQNYATNALDTANQSYGSRAPLRTAGVAGMLDPSKNVDVSHLSSIAGNNPFAGHSALSGQAGS